MEIKSLEKTAMANTGQIPNELIVVKFIGLKHVLSVAAKSCRDEKRDVQLSSANHDQSRRSCGDMACVRPDFLASISFFISRS